MVGLRSQLVVVGHHQIIRIYIQDQTMGNKESARHDDFQTMIHQMRKDQSRRVSINPEKKYLSLMKDTLISAKLPQTLKGLILDTLEEKVSEVELIETVTCINALRNNQFEVNTSRSQIIPKERPESKYVKVNFGEGFFKKLLGRFALGGRIPNEETPESSQSTSPVRTQRSHQPRLKSTSSQEEDKQQQRKQKLRAITQVMKKQLNRMIHPFGKLNKAFAEYIEGNSQEFAPKKCKEQVYEKSVRILINDWCAYLQVSCLAPYKKWIMGYVQLQENKYASWIRNLLMQEIWVVNNGYLFGMLATVITRCKTPLNIDIKELQEQAALLTPSLFNIDQKLQIQGHFFDSIYEMSQVVSRLKPQKILSQLQTVKKRICTDIDNYHRLVQVKQVYEIDSDNILGIVGYILCKIASKIDQIHTHLIFLRIVYTDKVYYTMGLGSYMLSTVFGAMEFLESQHFHELLNQKKTKHPQKKTVGKGGQSQTKVGTSAQGEAISGQEDVSQADLHVNSMLEHF